MNSFFRLSEPHNYFIGVSSLEPLLADNVLLFSRTSGLELKGKAQASSPHRRYVLCICLETRGSVYIDHQRIDLSTNQALLISPFRFHYYDHLESTALKWLFITFDSESDSPLLTAKPSALSLKKRHLKSLKKLSKLYQSLPKGDRHHHFLISANSFLYELLSQNPQKQNKRKTNPSVRRSTSWPQKIQRLLHQSPSLNISQIAKKLNISEGHLRHEFKKHQNMSLNDYVSHCRLHHAIQRLHDSDHSLLDISLELGFSSQAGFTRFFRRMTETTPARFCRDRISTKKKAL